MKSIFFRFNVRPRCSEYLPPTRLVPVGPMQHITVDLHLPPTAMLLKTKLPNVWNCLGVGTECFGLYKIVK